MVSLVALCIFLYGLGGLPLAATVIGVAAVINLYLSSPKAREVVGV